MDLKIISCNNFFKLRGELNKKNVEVFKSEFQEALQKFSTLSICVDGLEKVDDSGMEAFSGLYSKSLEKNIQFNILGRGCEALYQSLKTNEVFAA